MEGVCGAGASDLLSLPTGKDERFKKAFTRSNCSYENLCDKFRLSERNYTAQYAHIYFSRLRQMRKSLEAAAVKKWGVYAFSLVKYVYTHLKHHSL